MLNLKHVMASLCLLTTISFFFSYQIAAQQITPRYIAELSTVMRESSGIVTTGAGGFWTINDGTNGPKLHASDTTGNVYRTITLLNAFNYDWEDMTADPDGNIYIADTGDRNARYSPSLAYDDLSIYIVANPDYHCDNEVVAEVINFRFPTSDVDNAEGIFYHDNYIYIITKSDATGSESYAGQALLYRVPAVANPQQQYVAEYITEMDISQNGVSKDYYQVSSAALSPDGKLLVMVGETRLWIIQDFTEGIFFDGEVKTFDFSRRLQRESVDFIGNREIYITDEDEQVQSPTDGTLAYLDLCPYTDEENGCSQNFGIARSQADIYYNSAVESSSGQVTTQNSTLFIGNNQKTGLRFDDVNIPQGAKITGAYIQFRAYSSSSTSSNMKIYGDASTNASTFSTSYKNISNRTKTRHSANWQIGAWTSEQARNVQRTPDLGEIIQEVISNNSWNNYNALGFIFEGTGSRIAYSESACNQAAPELIVEYYVPLELDIRLWLEGTYDKQINKMKTDLGASRKVLPGQSNNTTVGQPYSKNPWSYNGDEGAYYADGNYPSDVVDWVLVSLRKTPQVSSTVARTAMLLRADGTIKSVTPIEFSERTTGNFYVVVEHRNHVGVMSMNTINAGSGRLSYDFRNKNSYGSPAQPAQKLLETGVWGMYAGDGDQKSDIGGYDVNGSDKIIFQIDNGDFYIYSSADFDMDGDVSGGDKAVWARNNGIYSVVPR